MSRKALEKDQEVKGFLSENILIDSSKSLSSPLESETPRRKSKNAHLLKFALVRSKESIPLALGDKICYFQKVYLNDFNGTSFHMFDS